MNIFVAENITKQYSGQKALDNVSISVESGSVFGLLGPNGAGKSTLIRIINQIIAPDNGTLFFEGEKLQTKHIAQMGYLPEERGLYKKMKVGEQALYLAQLKGLSKKEATQRLNFWFDKFEIGHWWNKRVEELSKGMQQKVQFVTTVLHQPKLLIFDEPFSGFDPINAGLLKNEILELRKQGATIIFSTHNMESVEELCDHIVLINKSKKILDGKISDIKEQYKKNIFRIVFQSTPDFEDSFFASYRILSKTKSEQDTEITLQLEKDSDATFLLETLLHKVRIISFNEVLPCVNDIFVEKVTSTI